MDKTRNITAKDLTEDGYSHIGNCGKIQIWRKEGFGLINYDPINKTISSSLRKKTIRDENYT
ncbi:MAG: hypothetical protein WCI41_03585 [bacterium]